MIIPGKDLLLTWNQWRLFLKLPQEYHRLVVYSEGSHDWPHIGPIIIEFFRLSQNEKVSYLSSEKNDPGLKYNHPRFESFYIGSGSVRTMFFKSLDAKLLLMTLPDLNVYYLKRSAAYPVHYVYCFHSINSIHTVYRERAFEFYDTIFCVGPHHVDELRREEVLKGVNPRQLLEHGSVKLDTVLKHSSGKKDDSTSRKPPLILLAPSWGDGSFAENYDLLSGIIKKIVGQNWECRLRLHPMTLRRHPQITKKLNTEFIRYKNSKSFAIEDNLNDNTSLDEAIVMVTDWSGAGTEFAFGLERPVLFIDMPQKINNPNWRAYGLPGLEDTIRNQIGKIINPSQIDLIPDCISKLINNSDKYKDQISIVREEYIFNIGQSATKGAEHLLNLLENPIIVNDK